MKYLLFFVFTLFSSNLFAGTGPTGLGPVHIGMSKAEYISATKIKPVNCNIAKRDSGESAMSGLESISIKNKELCWAFLFNETGSVENIQVGNLSYDVIQTNYSSSKFFQSIGNGIKAFFIKDRLISIEIYAPKVSIETLIAKYGEPKLVDKRKNEECTNGMGNKFNNNIGQLDGVWANGKVKSILRAETSSPNRTCTDGSTLHYYILEEPKQIKIIEKAIRKYKKSIAKKAVNNSPF